MTEKSTSLSSLKRGVRIDPNTHNFATLYIFHKALILSILSSISFILQI